MEQIWSGVHVLQELAKLNKESFQSLPPNEAIPAKFAEQLLPSLSTVAFLWDRPFSPQFQTELAHRDPIPGITRSLILSLNSDLVRKLVNSTTKLYDQLLAHVKAQPIQSAALIIVFNPPSHPLPDALPEGLMVAEMYAKQRIVPRMTFTSELESHLTEKNVVHISAHGNGSNGDQKALVFVTGRGTIVVHDEDKIVEAFKNHSHHHGGSVMLVVLNCCESGPLARRLKKEADIPFVIHWGDTLCTDEAAKVLTIALNLALHRGCTVPEAFSAAKSAITNILYPPDFTRPKWSLEPDTDRDFAGTPELLISDFAEQRFLNPTSSWMKKFEEHEKMIEQKIGEKIEQQFEKIQPIMQMLQRNFTAQQDGNDEFDNRRRPSLRAMPPTEGLAATQLRQADTTEKFQMGLHRPRSGQVASPAQVCTAEAEVERLKADMVKVRSESEAELRNLRQKLATSNLERDALQRQVHELQSSLEICPRDVGTLNESNPLEGHLGLEGTWDVSAKSDTASDAVSEDLYFPMPRDPMKDLMQDRCKTLESGCSPATPEQLYLVIQEQEQQILLLRSQNAEMASMHNEYEVGLMEELAAEKIRRLDISLQLHKENAMKVSMFMLRARFQRSVANRVLTNADAESNFNMRPIPKRRQATISNCLSTRAEALQRLCDDNSSFPRSSGDASNGAHQQWDLIERDFEYLDGLIESAWETCADDDVTNLNAEHSQRVLEIISETDDYTETH